MDENILQLAAALAKGVSHPEIVVSVCRILEQVVSDSKLVGNNWHPLGFLQFKLGRLSDNASLKLHIWPENCRKVQDPSWLIHRHEWYLYSHILVGTITNNTYSVVEVSEASFATNKLYKVEFDGMFSIIRDSGKLVNCKMTSRKKYSAGESYEVSDDDFHATIVPDTKWAATVVLSPPSSRDAPDVVGSLDGKETYSYERSPCEPDMLIEITNRLRISLACT